MLRFVICDDVPAQAAALAGMIRKNLAGTVPLEIVSVETADALYAALDQARPVDAVFLDIVLRDGNGIDAAKQINRMSPGTSIIFVSGFPVLAADVYGAKHVYFLEKPIRQKELCAALQRFVGMIEGPAQVFITLTGHKKRMFPLDGIRYFEHIGRESAIHTADGVFNTRLTLREIEALVPKNAFSRSHNSFLVNLSHVKGVDRRNVLMDDGTMLPVSNLRRQTFIDALSDSI